METCGLVLTAWMRIGNILFVQIPFVKVGGFLLMYESVESGGCSQTCFETSKQETVCADIASLCLPIGSIQTPVVAVSSVDESSMSFASTSFGAVKLLGSPLVSKQQQERI